MQVKRADVPLELEEIGLPMNTFGPKNPFIGKIVSVETITGANATGETCHIIIQVGASGAFGGCCAPRGGTAPAAPPCGDLQADRAAPTHAEQLRWPLLPRARHKKPCWAACPALLTPAADPALLTLPLPLPPHPADRQEDPLC